MKSTVPNNESPTSMLAWIIL